MRPCELRPRPNVYGQLYAVASCVGMLAPVPTGQLEPGAVDTPGRTSSHTLYRALYRLQVLKGGEHGGRNIRPGLAWRPAVYGCRDPGDLGGLQRRRAAFS